MTQDQLPLQVRRFADQMVDMDRRLRTIESGRRSPQLPYSSLDGGNLVVRDGSGMVRSVIGRQNDGNYTIVEANGPVPPMPDGITVEPITSGFTIRWSGQFFEGNLPSDFLRVDVHIEQVDGFTPNLNTVDSSINVPTGATIRFLTDDIIPHYIRLVTVTKSGVESEPTPVISVTPIEPPPGFVLEDHMIGAVHLETGAVTPESSAVGQTGNLVPDPSWSNAAWREKREGSFPANWDFVPEGGRFVLRSGTVGADQFVRAFVLDLPGVPVLPGEEYTLATAWKKDAGATGSVAIQCRFYSADGTNLGGALVSVDVATLSSTVYTSYSKKQVVPTNAVAATLQLYHTNGSAGNVYFSHATMLSNILPETFSNGTVNSQWIQRGAFMTDVIGQRAGFDSTGFYAWNANNEKIFGAQNGQGYFRGDLQIGPDIGPKFLFDESDTIIRMYPKAGSNVFIAQDMNYVPAAGGLPEEAQYILHHHDPNGVAIGGFMQLGDRIVDLGIRNASQPTRQYFGGRLLLSETGGAQLLVMNNTTTLSRLLITDTLAQITAPNVVELNTGPSFLNVSDTRVALRGNNGPSNSFGVFFDCVATNIPISNTGGPATSAYYAADGGSATVTFRLSFDAGSNTLRWVRNDTGAIVKNFIIQHPNDKDRHLVHTTTESPHNGVEYWGEVVTGNGRAEVTLPSYFESLTDSEGRAVLVSIVIPDTKPRQVRSATKSELPDDRANWMESDEFEDEAPMQKALRERENLPRRKKMVKVDEPVPAAIQFDELAYLANVAATQIKNGKFRVLTNGPSGTRVSWLVKAVRKDVPKLIVEPLKSDIVVHGDGPYTWFTNKK